MRQGTKLASGKQEKEWQHHLHQQEEEDAVRAVLCVVCVVRAWRECGSEGGMKKDARLESSAAMTASELSLPPAAHTMLD